MEEYITPKYKTITAEKQRKIVELFTSSILNAFTDQDFYDCLSIMKRVIDRLEGEE